MGRKGNWFSSVKRALRSDSKESKDSKPTKPKKKWFGKQIALDSNHRQTAKEPFLPPHPQSGEQNEETKHVMTNAVVDVPEVTQFVHKSTEEVAAIYIQKSFRGYQARKALRGLRGLVRLKSLIEGPTTKRQVMNTMQCMQTLSRLQSQIHSRRLRLLEENQALQRQILHKRAKEFENLKTGEEWSDTLQSKEQIEANLLKKFEAAMRRERALAYSFTHQQTWKSQPRSTNPMFLDPTNLGWGWSWLERWMATRPCETKGSNHKTSPSTKNNTAGEINKSYAKYQLNLSKRIRKLSIGGGEDDLKSIGSVQSEMTRRHSVGAASVRDDESLGSSASVPRYMVVTQSAKAKSRFPNPLATEKSENAEKVSPGVAKKRLSFSPAAMKQRRYSAPPKVNNGSTVSEESMTNGGNAA